MLAQNNPILSSAFRALNKITRRSNDNGVNFSDPDRKQRAFGWNAPVFFWNIYWKLEKDLSLPEFSVSNEGIPFVHETLD